MSPTKANSPPFHRKDPQKELAEGHENLVHMRPTQADPSTSDKTKLHFGFQKSILLPEALEKLISLPEALGK